MDKWRRIGTILCVATVLGFTSCDDYDDDNVRYDNNRFYSDFRASNLFENADANNNQTLDEDEFNENAFNTWDTNRDGTVDQTEFNRAAADFRVINNDMSTWDTNADNSLDRQEFATGFRTNNFFTAWDADTSGNLTEREFTDGTFRQLDAGGTGQMTAADYNRFNNAYFRF